MVENFAESVKDKQRIKDQLGERDTYNINISSWKVEVVNVYTTSVKLYERTIGTSFILNHSTNDVLNGSFILSSTAMSAWSATTAQTISNNQRITNDGKQVIVDWLYGSTIQHFDNVSIGNGTTEFSITDDELYDEDARNTSFNVNYLDNNGLSSSIVAYYKLDNDVLDSVGTNNGTNVNATYTSSGKINGCYSFNGSTSKITLGATGNYNAYTVNVWIKPTSLNTTNEVFGHHYYFTMIGNNADGSWVFGCGDGADWGNYVTAPAGSIEAGKWYMLTMTGDGTNINVYINNVFIGTAVNSNNLNSTPNIGFRNNRTQYFHGLIDELSIWNKVLSTSERTALYNSGYGLSLDKFTATPVTNSVTSSFTDSTYTIREVGLHNASTTGSMFTRSVFNTNITMVKAKAYKVEFSYGVDDA